ncbi:MAG: YopX family protein [Thiomicrorhabdus sp.]|nr:YopX family protein [Thiomicrorhabdus sp.]
MKPTERSVALERNLWRAKRIFKGTIEHLNQWVYGSLREFQGKTYILVDGITSIEVNPHTVGQWTGLEDSNGNKIFEGDIVKVHDDWDTYGFMAGESREVYFHAGGFRLKPEDKNSKGHWFEDGSCCKITGNVHHGGKDKNV